MQDPGDMTLAELANGCPELMNLIISHCPNITDAGLGYLVKGCTRLQSLQIVYCPGITSAGVATVISGCTSIKKVLVEKRKVSPRTHRQADSVLSFLHVDL